MLSNGRPDRRVARPEQHVAQGRRPVEHAAATRYSRPGVLDPPRLGLPAGTPVRRIREVAPLALGLVRVEVRGVVWLVVRG